ncbi:transcriptional regulator [Photobacterium phosphoreum]|uniref:Transcriptional regulator n=1 Tax=Photobacterium phosphoreum TaxID=659 RepID=A0AAW4ZIV5_PHOPO|nr:helix-turn-helix domain-containing protein [Photobacterium phosphoreum]MCD9491090.1 transcriptional regulator [Photobacterium phosphoreum]MCF2190300.1 transcriptional regulator [Photobacterium phosphoreum]MCF2300887.1 transcriptional regulator [Photobacterium phosphoreum]
MQTKIPAFNYKGGRSVTEKLKLLTKVDEFQDLATVFDIPRSTISTWHTRNMTPYEIIVRVCLATGCSIKWLAMDEGEPFSDGDNSATEEISIEKISNGLLENESSMRLDLVTLEKYGLKASSTKAIDHDSNIHFINTQENNPTVGRYLISIDGNISINRIQRLPGKKLAISFGDSTLEVSDDDINVIGRIVMTMEKE